MHGWGFYVYWRDQGSGPWHRSGEADEVLDAKDAAERQRSLARRAKHTLLLPAVVVRALIDDPLTLPADFTDRAETDPRFALVDMRAPR